MSNYVFAWGTWRRKKYFKKEKKVLHFVGEDDILNSVADQLCNFEMVKQRKAVDNKKM